MNKDHVMSGGDDGTVRCWDVSTGEAVAVLGKHDDRVRAGVTSPASPDVWASAGYDNKIRVWDVRAKYVSIDQSSLVTLVLIFMTTNQGVH